MNKHDIINNSKKAELHIHLEGSLEPQMMLDLALSNSIKLKHNNVHDIAGSYKFNNLQEFLDLYYMGMSVLKTSDDFFNLTYAYLTRAHLDNVTHTEMFFDPQAHTMRGISLDHVINGIWRATKKANLEYNIETQLIPCFLRDLSETEALKTFEALMQHREYFVGIGLDSNEVGNPPIKFKNLFETARQEKLKLVSHAGEEGDYRNVWEAIDILGVDRIDHGNAAISDESLIKRIVTDKIPLTMCPLSNKCLQVVPDLHNHPARNLLNQGVMVTINSDDPSYFGGYINDNFNALDKALNFTTDEIKILIQNSFNARFSVSPQPL